MVLINGALSLLCAVLALLLIAALLISPQWRRGKAAKPAFLIMAFTFVTLLCDGLAQVCFTDQTNVYAALATAAGVASFLVEWSFCLFIVSQVNVSGALKRLTLIALGVISLTGCALYIVNAFHPFVYDFRTEQYLATGAYWTFSILNYAFFAFSVLLLLFRGGNMPIRDRIFLSITPLLPLTSLLWDYLFPGLYSWYPLTFISMAANYVHMMFMMAENAQEKIDRLELKRIRATLERIKPHYIYNVLASIYYLCDLDVETAKEAVLTFSDYLRDTLNMMEEQALIPVSQEIRTVRNYLELEQMRFGDRIRVRYQIETDHFRIPPFSLQPLVENSVKHGVEHTDGNGEIVVSSREEPDCYVLSVQDSFSGFDPDRPENVGSGTKYVHEILALTVQGTLQIRSAPGEGTVAEIRIPKETQPPEDGNVSSFLNKKPGRSV